MNEVKISSSTARLLSRETPLNRSLPKDRLATELLRTLANAEYSESILVLMAKHFKDLSLLAFAVTDPDIFMVHPRFPDIMISMTGDPRCVPAAVGLWLQFNYRVSHNDYFALLSALNHSAASLQKMRKHISLVS